ncbi:hypothetical protein [Streptomyces sedi]|uniref:Uncharacterized protein n=1 Tax=Streptomyces sedi TaxID=555059 RepID=A0A5C4UPK1_9ACTN|nr:hypothetical protein [Streptomyces sedi]TNM25153.1 hypothetical protein FH715_26560 [Streptomyces sedi]
MTTEKNSATPAGPREREALAGSLVPALSDLAIVTISVLGVAATIRSVATAYLTQRGETRRAEIAARARVEVARIQRGAPPVPPAESADS